MRPQLAPLVRTRTDCGGLEGAERPQLEPLARTRAHCGGLDLNQHGVSPH